MNIKNSRHKGLKRFIEKDDPSGLPAAKVEKIRDIITALLVAETVEDIPALPGWKLHALRGDRKGQWSIAVTGNWRIVFEIIDNQIFNLNLEDYH